MKLSRRTKKTLVAYTVIYLITCFTRWEIYNPWDTLKQIPALDPCERFGALFLWIVAVFILQIGLWMYDPNAEDSENEFWGHK